MRKINKGKEMQRRYFVVGEKGAFQKRHFMTKNNEQESNSIFLQVHVVL